VAITGWARLQKAEAFFSAGGEITPHRKARIAIYGAGRLIYCFECKNGLERQAPHRGSSSKRELGRSRCCPVRYALPQRFARNLSPPIPLGPVVKGDAGAIVSHLDAERFWDGTCAASPSGDRR
jgi:hypothetical protein